MLVSALIGLILLLMYIPFIKSVIVLHGVFALLGFGTAVTGPLLSAYCDVMFNSIFQDTGCQILSRKAHGTEAGPWLGVNTVLFGIAGE